MPTLVMTKWPRPVDGSVRGKTLVFLQKLAEDDTSPGLHVEPLNGSADPRVRTGRVDEFWRAVMFRLDVDRETHYVIHGVWPHDEAIKVAQKLRLKINPVNGLPLFEEVSGPTPAVVSAPVRPPAARPLLEAYSRADLVDRLGVPETVAAAALTVTNEDALLSMAQEQEGWIGTVLVDLAAGDPIDTIAERLGIEKAPATREEDADILDSMRRPGAQMQFAFIDNQEELRRVIEGGDFGAWRVFLHPEQRRYAERSYSGPFRLTGGAGTGKTVVLVHRARTLAQRNPQARIVVTTFTTNLADTLRDMLADLDPHLPIAPGLGKSGIYVAGVDALASAALKVNPKTVGSAMGDVLGEARSSPVLRAPGTRWREVLETTSTSLPAEIANETFLAVEYDLVVLPNHVHDEASYLRVRRPGRSLALDRAKRSAVWELMAAYRARNRADGRLDFAEAAAVAAAHLGSIGPLADHVLVDEGQDLSPTHWQMLRAVVAEGPDDIFIAEDAHQRIYGSRIVLSRYGIRVTGRSRHLTLNYRTTAQNLRYALTLLEGGSYVDLEDLPEPTGYRSARTGPAPQVITVKSLAEELDSIATQARTWLANGTSPETIAVLVADRSHRERVVTALTERDVPARAIDRERAPNGKVLVMTMHRAKGMEFAKVILSRSAYRSQAEQTRLASLDESERADVELRNRSLLYVAASRARDELVVIQR
jgi:superfamily I DNA/RNA helicase